MIRAGVYWRYFEDLRWPVCHPTTVILFPDWAMREMLNATRHQSDLHRRLQLWASLFPIPDLPANSYELPGLVPAMTHPRVFGIHFVMKEARSCPLVTVGTAGTPFRLKVQIGSHSRTLRESLRQFQLNSTTRPSASGHLQLQTSASRHCADSVQLHSSAAFFFGQSASTSAQLKARAKRARRVYSASVIS